jgi:diguanylate cyclase (GGDEF)-like protein
MPLPSAYLSDQELSRRQSKAKRLKSKPLLATPSNEDPLTHFYDTKGFAERLLRLVERSAFRRTVLAGIMIDIDDFKATNEAFGHAVGDDVLVAVAHVIWKALRPGDVCSRVGGDEFFMLLPECPASESIHIAERVRTVINTLRIPAGTGNVTVTPSVSVGVFVVPTHVESVREALQVATPFLLKAKSAGKNVVAN